MSFDPNEPRDPKTGMWSSLGGAPENNISETEAREAEDARRMQIFARSLANEMDYDPENVFVTTDQYPFKLNGKDVTAAGTATKDGPIKLYSKNIPAPSLVPEILAHEIMHQKFNAFMDATNAQGKLRVEDIKTRPTKEIFLNNSSDQMTPEFAAKYPALNALAKFQENITDRAKEDGVTRYSAEWWAAWNAGKVQTHNAITETLAEMTSQKYLAEKGKTHEVRAFDDYPDGSPRFFLTGKEETPYNLTSNMAPPRLGANGKLIKTGGRSPHWAALYDAVNDHWNKLPKDKRR